MPQGILAPPTSATQAGWQALVVGMALAGFGFVVVSGVAGHRVRSTVARAALAFPALAGYALVLECAHWASGGRVFSNPALVRVVTGVVAATAAIAWVVRMMRARRGGSPSPRQAAAWWVLLILAVAAGIAIWTLANFEMLPMARGGDTPGHLAWSEQLLDGQPVPTAPLSGPVPNYYPWLYHALLALVTVFTPGLTAYHATAPLQVVTVTASVCGFFALGRSMTGRPSTAVAAAVLGSLAGGFGYFVTRSPTLVNPRNAAAVQRFMGDFMIKRSYDIAFANLAPPYPREIGFVLIPVAAMLLIAGARRGSYAAFVAAGLCTGLMGLSCYESFATMAAVGVTAILVNPGGRNRLLALACFGLPALALWLLWVGPLLISYERYGGFRSLAAPPVVVPAAAILGSWGVATPLALVGARRLRNLREPAVLLPLCLVVVTGAAIAIPAGEAGAVAPGFQTLLRDHRFWPLMYAGIASFGALGFTDVADGARALARRIGLGGAGHRLVPALLTLILVGLALPSPVLADAALPRKLGRSNEVTRSLEGHRTWLTALDEGFGRHPTVAVPRPLEKPVSSYTGYQELVYYWTQVNFGRVRFKGMVRRLGGKAPRLKANRILVQGDASPARWRATARRWGVDRVVVPASRLQSPGFRGCRTVQPDGSPYVVVLVTTCR